MEATPTKTRHLPLAILTEILAKLPLRSISRFKYVCKPWKSTLESVFFRRLFVSLHKNPSLCWSLMRGANDMIGSHGCETWDLSKSLASYIPSSFKSFLPLGSGNLAYKACSNGLVLIEGIGYDCYVGNPVLQQWVQIPSPPRDSVMFCLATRVDKDGVVLGFKVVTLVNQLPVESDDVFSICLSVCMYSSETGIWTSKQLHCPHLIYGYSPLNLDGTIYLSQRVFDLDDPGVLIVHDFYSESDQCQAIPLPDHSNQNNQDFKTALTTSRGFVMYIQTLAQMGDNILKVWRLSNDSGNGSWQFFQEIRLAFIPSSDIGSYAPMAMHPFDSDIVYIWSDRNHHLVSCNLLTENYRILKDASKLYNDGHQDCFMNHSICKEYMNKIWGSKMPFRSPYCNSCSHGGWNWYLVLPKLRC